MTPIASIPQLLSHLGFIGQLLGSESSLHVLIIFLDLFCSVSSVDGGDTIASKDDFDVILD